MKPEILVAGNSHVRYLLGGHGSERCEHDKFVCRGKQFGSTGSTIWGLDNPASRTQSGRCIAEFVVAEAQRGASVCDASPLRLVLCLGEVDVRAHVMKHAVSIRTCSDVVCDIIHRYERYIDEKITDYCGSRLVLMGTIPYTRAFYENSKELKPKMLRYVSGLFNSALATLCNEREWTYLDCYEGLVDDEGFLRDELAQEPTTASDIHLNNRASEFLVPQLERYLASR